jgi:hypothetical protein
MTSQPPNAPWWWWLLMAVLLLSVIDSCSETLDWPGHRDTGSHAPKHLDRAARPVWGYRQPTRQPRATVGYRRMHNVSSQTFFSVVS